MRVEESPEPASRSDQDDEDRVVSRRVHNPTEATDEDGRSYPGAPDSTAPHSPVPDSDGTTERAAHDLAAESDEPTRSE